MDSKDIYREFAAANDADICIYAKPWWLDLMCGNTPGGWNVILSLKEDNIRAALPYYIKNKYGLQFITQPFLTQHCGLYLPIDDSYKNEKKYQTEQEIMNELIEKLESDEGSIAYFKQNMPHTFYNGLPFYWKGYRLETRYTYLIRSSSISEAEIEKNYSKVVRYDLKKASKLCNVVESDDVEQFYKLYCQTYERQNLKPPVSFSKMLDIDSVCREHSARRLIFAESNDGKKYCAAYFVMDNKYVYYLFSGTDIKYRNANALCLLIADGIRFACDTGRDFDFEGSMTKNINDYFRKFGAVQTPYLSVTKIMTKNPVLKQVIKLKFS